MTDKPEAYPTIIALIVVASSIGCWRSTTEPVAKVTPTQTRADRRAYDGAPPVIPHKPLNADCVTCHTPTGKLVPNMTFAPANPHSVSSHMGQTQNCRQCHLFQRSTDTFVDNEFVGLPQEITPSETAYPGAPPTVPHSDLMRENCLACHAGPSARPEIKCSHTNRTNCRQCHVSASETSVQLVREQ